MKFLFLLNSASDYFFNSIEYLCKQGKNQAMVLMSTRAPYNFDYTKYSFSKNIFLLNKINYFVLMKKINNFECDIIYTVNYHLRIYRKIFKNFNGPVILGTDNMYRNTLKQFISRFISRFYLLPFIDAIMLPVKKGRHLLWAQKMGFSKKQITDNFFSASHKFYKNNKKTVRKSFIFLGRFENEKGIDILLEAYKLYKKNCSVKTHYSLNIYGCGSLNDYIKKKINKIQGISLKSFIESDEKKKIITSHSFLILPSIYEPFGVVTHEALCSGRPVILSDECGSREIIINNYNGFIFKSHSITDLAKVMIKISKLSNNKIIKMFKNAYLSSFQLSNKKFSQNLTRISTDLLKRISNRV